MRMGIEITNEMIERAKQEADKREKYIEHHFSVEHLTDDKRNIIGFLGEFACCELLGVDWKKNIRSDYLTIDSGDINIGDYLIDVKTETIPQPYFNEVFNRRINDDKAYGRRLITEEQIPLLAKYNIVIFGAFVREKYNKWYALGYLETSYITNNYTATTKAPFGRTYPEPAVAIRNSDIHRMNRLIEYANRVKSITND